MTVTEAARYFGKSERTIRRWCRNRILVGRYKCVVIHEKTECWTILKLIR